MNSTHLAKNSFTMELVNLGGSSGLQHHEFNDIMLV